MQPEGSGIKTEYGTYIQDQDPHYAKRTVRCSLYRMRWFGQVSHNGETLGT